MRDGPSGLAGIVHPRPVAPLVVGGASACLPVYRVAGSLRLGMPVARGREHAQDVEQRGGSPCRSLRDPPPRARAICTGGRSGSRSAIADVSRYSGCRSGTIPSVPIRSSLTNGTMRRSCTDVNSNLADCGSISFESRRSFGEFVRVPQGPSARAGPGLDRCESRTVGDRARPTLGTARDWRRPASVGRDSNRGTRTIRPGSLRISHESADRPRARWAGRRSGERAGRSPVPPSRGPDRRSITARQGRMVAGGPGDGDGGRLDTGSAHPLAPPAACGPRHRRAGSLASRRNRCARNDKDIDAPRVRNQRHPPPAAVGAARAGAVAPASDPAVTYRCRIADTSCNCT